MSLYIQNGVELACDDFSGATPYPGMVHAAKKTEMDYFKGMAVYDRVPRSEQWDTKGNIIGTTWIDVHQLDFENHHIRSRLVGNKNPNQARRCALCEHTSLGGPQAADKLSCYGSGRRALE